MDVQKLIERRMSLGLTQQDVADAAGMAQQAYARLEKGGRPNPRINTVEAIAEVLKCKVDDLLAESKNRVRISISMTSEPTMQEKRGKRSSRFH